MSENEKIEEGKQLIEDLSEILRVLSDEEIGEFFKEGTMDYLLNSILNPSDIKKFPNAAEFFLANKNRSSLLAGVRYAITLNYSFIGHKDGKTGFVSPYNFQWFDEGVILQEGTEPFAGLIVLYRDGNLSYAVAARDIGPGEKMGHEDFEFISMEDALIQLSKISSTTIARLDEPIQEFTSLIDNNNNNEAEYQEFLEKYPWVFGAQYSLIQRHTNLDDSNIPDFTGVRVHDNYRDIIELKPPFMKLFRNNGNFSSNFNDAWNQAERYLNFAREEKDYLNRKGMRFDNPKCYLVLGLNLSVEKIREIRRKEKMNPAIQLITYDDLLAFIKSTVKFVRMLKTEDITAKNE